MKHCFTLIFLAFSYLAAAQVLPGRFFNNLDTAPCPTDTTQTINIVHEWEVYQTTNDEWDGPRDSTACINFTDGLNARLEFDEVDSGKTVFVRCFIDTNFLVSLNEDNLYFIKTLMEKTSGLELNQTDTCPDGYCSGVRVGVDIPDSAGTGRDIRWYDNLLDVTGPNSWIEPSFCMVTEKFVDDSYIREFIYKLTPSANNPAGQNLRFSQVDIMDYWEVQDWFTGDYPVGIHNATIQNYNQGQFDYVLQEWWMANFVVMHKDSGYPNANNISYVDLSPVPNTSTQDTVTITVNSQASLYYQPYTQFRGGLVSGDTTRHAFNLVNDGSDICLETWLEVIFEGLNSYTHKSGSLTFHGKESCMLFGKGGKLIVDEGATLHYGSKDEGMLGVFTGGTIEIREGGELIIYNKMMIDEYKHETEPGQVFMELKQGTKLTFAPGSRCIANGIDDLMKLNIYMRGGEIDLSGLPREDLKNINLIYETVDEDWNGLEVYNTNTNEIEYAFDAMKEGTATIQVFDMNGKLVLNENITTTLGKNERYLNTSLLENGVYVLALVINGKRKTQKFVKI